MNCICRVTTIRTTRDFFRVAIPLLSLAALAGCGGAANSDRPHTVPVEGTITHQGQPLADASVTFLPANKEGRSAVARTDSAGRYSLRTFEPGDGAIPGDYGVQIVKYEEPDAEPEDGVTPPLKSLIPEKYTTVATSGLKATVTDDGTNNFDFDLE